MTIIFFFLFFTCGVPRLVHSEQGQFKEGLHTRTKEPGESTVFGFRGGFWLQRAGITYYVPFLFGCRSQEPRRVEQYP